MSVTPTQRSVCPRPLGRLLVAKAVYGTVLLVAAPVVPGRAAGIRIDRRARVGAGAVGARNLAEVAIIRSHPTPTAIAAAAAIDATHAASMVILAVARPGRRRLATASAVAAGLFAAAAVAALRPPPPIVPSAA